VIDPDGRRAGREPFIGEAAALAALGLLVVVLALSPITDYDLFLHLKTGAVVLETGHVPRVDDYSALARGRPFVAHEWLSGVLFRVIERVFGRYGLPALTTLVAAVALGIAASLYGAARFLGASPVLAVPMLAFVMVLAAARLYGEAAHLLVSHDRGRPPAPGRKAVRATHPVVDLPAAAGDVGEPARRIPPGSPDRRPCGDR